MADNAQNSNNNPGDGNASDKGDKDQAGKQTQDQKAQDQTVPYARFKEVNEGKKALEKELQSVADAMKEDVPEEFRDLIPDGLSPSGLIKWLRSAFAKGLFSPKAAADALDTKRPGEKKALDLEKLSPLQMREMGYGKT